MENPRAVWAGRGRRTEWSRKPVQFFPSPLLSCLKQSSTVAFCDFVFWGGGLHRLYGCCVSQKVKPSQDDCLLVSIPRALLVSRGKGLDFPPPLPMDHPLGLLRKGMLPQRRAWGNKNRWLGWEDGFPWMPAPSKGTHAVCKLEEKGKQQQKRQAEGKEGP